MSRGAFRLSWLGAVALLVGCRSTDPLPPPMAAGPRPSDDVEPAESAGPPATSPPQTLAELPEPSASPEPAKPPPPWSYIFPNANYGIRADKGGQGHFLAPRTHGKHNGVDLLAPMGTTIVSPCKGEAMSGTSGSFGKYVHLVCPLPAVGEAKGLYASLFFSHLAKDAVASSGYRYIKRDDPVGEVGKTGNARGATIMPHLHLELIVHATAAEARRETHSGRAQHNTKAADRYVAALEQSCFGPAKLTAQSGATRRKRRLDPVLVFQCLAAPRPAFSRPKPPLHQYATPFSQYYTTEIDLDAAVSP